MSGTTAAHRRPILLKHLTPDEVRTHLDRDPRLILPVGTTEQHGPHLPLGCDTLIVERLADDLSAEFGVLRAPTIEYGVNAQTARPFAGSASLHFKTLHRLINDLVESWETGGVREFVILTAHGPDPHQEALSTLSLREARVRTVDIFSVPLPDEGTEAFRVVHGGEIDTSLLLYVDPVLVRLALAQDFEATPAVARRYQRGARSSIPVKSPGSLGRPSLASVEKGERLYHLIYERVASRIFRAP